MAILTDFEKKRYEEEKEKIQPDLSFNENQNVLAFAPRTASIPGVRIQNNAPSMIGNYSFDTDFMEEKQKAEKAGDYGKAKLMEKYRNQKLGYMDSPYDTTYHYNYNDPYLGERERMRQEIINREPFEYDYQNDAQYQAIRRLKQKEADENYADTYGQLSRQFEGDIPVNMINKLNKTKADIVDQADNYIPQLYQLARQKYMDEGDKLKQDYLMLDDISADDYNRFLADRDMRVSGLENSYARNWAEKTYNDDMQRYLDELNYNRERNALSDARYEREWDYQKERDKKEDERWEREYLLNQYRTYK